jgi:Uncharacterized protein conserved in bacteria (DUF2309).
MMRSIRKSKSDAKTILAQPVESHLSDNQKQAVIKACELIAPTWPLDELIAVNPWWEMRDMPFTKVSAKVSALRKAQCLMPKSYFQEVWMETLLPDHLEQAAQDLGKDFSVETLERYLIEDDERSHWHNISDLVDSGRDRKSKWLGVMKSRIRSVSSARTSSALRWTKAAMVQPIVDCIQSGWGLPVKTWE